METVWAAKLETRLPLPANRRFRRALHELDTVVYRLIDERKRPGGNRPDLLSMLLSARGEDTGERMTDRQLRDEVIRVRLAARSHAHDAASYNSDTLPGRS